MFRLVSCRFCILPSQGLISGYQHFKTAKKKKKVEEHIVVVVEPREGNILLVLAYIQHSANGEATGSICPTAGFC